MSENKNQDISEKNEKRSKKKGIGISHYIFTVIVSVLIVAIGITQYRVSLFQQDIYRNIATVNTAQLIQEQRLAEIEKLKNGQTSSTTDNMEQYIKDMQEIVDSLSAKYDVILVERGAIVSKGFIDLTPQVRQRLVDRGYIFLR